MNWHFQTVVLEKTPESSLDYKEIKSINPKGNQLWIFTGKTDAAAEALILWPPDMKKRILDNREVGKQLIGGKETTYRWLI